MLKSPYLRMSFRLINDFNGMLLTSSSVNNTTCGAEESFFTVYTRLHTESVSHSFAKT